MGLGATPTTISSSRTELSPSRDGRAHVNFATKNDGADFCVDTTIADAPAPDNTALGLVFWWADWDNYYYLYYWTDGSMVVRRVVKGKETDLFWVTTLAIKKGVGATNQFELKLRPKDANDPHQWDRGEALQRRAAEGRRRDRRAGRIARGQAGDVQI